jgi:hypothetical protein
MYSDSGAITNDTPAIPLRRYSVNCLMVLNEVEGDAVAINPLDEPVCMQFTGLYMNGKRCYVVVGCCCSSIMGRPC